MSYYEYKIIVGFEETNLTGNVYFANHIRWQGKCREMFIKEKSPGILTAIENGSLALITLKCSCEYFDEIKAFDEVTIKMRLEGITGHRISMSFEYTIRKLNQSVVAARGMQEIGCMSRFDQTLKPIQPPQELIDALNFYR